jgi:hypothetical protein
MRAVTRPVVCQTAVPITSRPSPIIPASQLLLQALCKAIYFVGGESGTLTVSSWLVLVAADWPWDSACVPSDASVFALAAASRDLRALNFWPRPPLFCCGAGLPLAEVLAGSASFAFLREPSSWPVTCRNQHHMHQLISQISAGWMKATRHASSCRGRDDSYSSAHLNAASA